MDYSLPGFSVHGISQTRILEQAAILLSRDSSQLRDQIPISCTGRWILYHQATREAPWPVSPTLSQSVNQYFCLLSLLPTPQARTHTHTQTHTHTWNLLRIAKPTQIQRSRESERDSQRSAFPRKTPLLILNNLNSSYI